MNLSPHFTYEEATLSPSAVRAGVDNTPNAVILDNMKMAASKAERVRILLNHPMIISSWYRSLKVNAMVGGAQNPPSAHTLGWAIDFVCPQFGTPLEICKAIKDSDIQFDQLIMEGRWVHISFDPRMRRQVLTAHFGGLHGTTYSLGLE